MNKAIQDFFTSKAYGVIGVSTNRFKFGNKVLRVYLQHQLPVYPIHPTEKEIEGVMCLASLADLPEDVKSLSIITPPPVTEKLVPEIIKKGIKYVWMQPGAESHEAINKLKAAGITVIANGPCILVELNFKE